MSYELVDQPMGLGGLIQSHQGVHESSPSVGHSFPAESGQGPLDQLPHEVDVLEHDLRDGGDGQHLNAQTHLPIVSRRKPQIRVPLVGPQNSHHLVGAHERGLVNVVVRLDMPQSSARQILQSRQRETHIDQVRVPERQSHQSGCVVSVHGLAGALLVPAIGELRQAAGPRVHHPRIEAPQAREVVIGGVRVHVISHQRVEMAPPGLAPAGIELGQHRSGVAEVSEMEVVVVVHGQAEIGPGIVGPIAADDAAPLAVVEQGVARERAIEPWSDGADEKFVHSVHDRGARDLLGDEPQSGSSRQRFAVEVRGGDCQLRRAQLIDLLERSSDDVVFGLRGADAVLRVPADGERLGA
ncbi:hypothetical protein Mapa_015967 [Marchantia paleacea]|nr:hypothetical protein Mapa_015967 [Marchantia paleacea]